MVAFVDWLLCRLGIHNCFTAAERLMLRLEDGSDPISEAGLDGCLRSKCPTARKEG